MKGKRHKDRLLGVYKASNAVEKEMFHSGLKGFHKKRHDTDGRWFQVGKTNLKFQTGKQTLPKGKGHQFNR